ncbi:MAG TPA: MnhB domain-containing protein [Rhodocyclaceae bacterium]|nr:MnhB domain-containing protein [Rhodocyclaceae bacterium]
MTRHLGRTLSRNAFAALLCVVVTLALAWALVERPVPAEHLPQRVAASLDASGVSHPVTAVLLNFRSFDTLLEVGVLLLAVVIALALREAQPDHPDRMGLDNPLLRAVMAWLLPLMLSVAGYLLWAGSSRPGGAFQAGAVLAAAGVLLRLAGVTLPGFNRPALLRSGLAIGLLVFVIVGAAATAGGGALLEYPVALAGGLIVLIELALTLSIALALLSLFRLAPPHADHPGDDARQANDGADASAEPRR